MLMASEKEDRDWVDGAAAGFHFVRFTMSDINGISRSKLIPRRHVDEKLKSGISMCAGKLPVKQICSQEHWNWVNSSHDKRMLVTFASFSSCAITNYALQYGNKKPG